MDDRERFEQDVADMLEAHVANLPASYDIDAALLQRARRVRATKLTALAVAAVVVVGGTTGAIARIVGRDDPRRVTTSIPTSTVSRPSVRTVGCPVNTEVGNGKLSITIAAPTTEPRVPDVGNPKLLSTLESFAAIDDPSYVVLGPDSWSCLATFTNHANRIVVYDPQATPGKVPGLDEAPIKVQNAILWNDFARLLACSVFDDPLFRQPTNSCVNSRSSYRTVTRVDAHVASFVDADGARGVGWLELPSSDSASDGHISVLTCRPTEGLTADECDTIIADFIARNDAEYASPTTTTATPSTTTTTLPARVATAGCPISYALTSHSIEHPSTEPRVPAAGDPALFSHFASFAATNDPRFLALGPAAWSCQGLMAADGDNGMVVYKTLTPSGAVPDIFTAPIAIENGYLWHGGVGSGTACSVFDEPSVVQYMTANFPQELPCPRAGRTVTRIDSRVSTFVDADGARGVGWIVLPSAQSADDGKISVLTCRPTDGLTAAECDTIIADWIARNDT